MALLSDILMDDRTRLEQKRKRLVGKLPPPGKVLRGSLLKRYRKCGKPRCHCAQGQPHGPNYYVAVKQRNGRTATIPVPLEYKSIVRQYISNYRKLKIILEEISKTNTELIQRKLLKRT